MTGINRTEDYKTSVLVGPNHHDIPYYTLFTLPLSSPTDIGPVTLVSDVRQTVALTSGHGVPAELPLMRLTMYYIYKP
jgi:hypothetical protein